jgi:ribosomal protein S19E (S16A)
MEDNPALKLSPSEKRTLQGLAQGELPSTLDRVAIQRLRTLGYVEDRSTGVAITEEGRRAMRRLHMKD